MRNEWQWTEIGPTAELTTTQVEGTSINEAANNQYHHRY